MAGKTLLKRDHGLRGFAVGTGAGLHSQQARSKVRGGGFSVMHPQDPAEGRPGDKQTGAVGWGKGVPSETRGGGLLLS